MGTRAAVPNPRTDPSKSVPSRLFLSRLRRRLPFLLTPLRRPDSERQREEAERADMAAMLVGALRRGSGCRGGLRLIAHSLRRFVSPLIAHAAAAATRIRSIQFSSSPLSREDGVCFCVCRPGEHARRSGARRRVRQAVVAERIGRRGGNCQGQQSFCPAGWFRAGASQGRRPCRVQPSTGV